LLSSQIVPTGSNVTVLAGKGNDTITLDLSAAPPNTTQPQFSVVGGGGDVSLSVTENAAQSVGWHLDGGGAGHIDGSVQVGFTGVDHLLGGGADTLYGSATDTSWTVNGAGSGNVGTTQFSGFANLVGAAGQKDVFNVTAGGSLTGSINAGGNGTLAINAGAAESWQLDGAGAGQATGPVQIAFTGVDDVVGSGADTLYDMGRPPTPTGRSMAPDRVRSEAPVLPASPIWSGRSARTTYSTSRRPAACRDLSTAAGRARFISMPAVREQKYRPRPDRTPDPSRMPPTPSPIRGWRRSSPGRSRANST
jgi:hypothetical protein